MATVSRDVFEAKFGADSSEYLSELRKIERKSIETLDKVNSVTNKAAVTFAALAAVVGVTTAAFVQYEKSLIGVQKTTGLTDEETQKLGESITELSERGPTSALALLAIAEAAGQLGIKGSDNILKFTDTVSKLGLTTDLQGGEAAKILARILNVAGEGAEDVNKLGSAFVRLGNSVAASESEIALVSLEVAKSTTIFKIGAANVAGLGATLAALGVQSEIGGSVVGRAFIKIREAIDSGGDSAQRLSKTTGIAVDELKDTFERDAAGVFIKFLGRLEEVVESGGNATEFLKDFGLKGAGVNKVLLPLATSLEQLKINLKASGEEYKTGAALTAEYNKAVSSTDARLKTAKNSLTAATVALGEQFAPTIVSLTEKLASLISWFNELDTGTVNVISRITLAVGAVAGIITVIGLATKAVIGLRLAFAALTLASGPLGLFITAITTAGVALAAFYATAPEEAEKGGKKLVDQQKKNNEDFKKIVEEGNTTVEGLSKKSNDKITKSFKKSNDERLKEIKTLQLKRQELLRQFDQTSIAKDEAAAKTQLEIEKTSLEALQLERDGATQEAIALKNEELQSLKTLQELRLESAKINAQSEKSVLEIITLEKNKSLLELETKNLDEIRDKESESFELRQIDIGDFEERTRDLIESSFDEKKDTQARKLAEIDDQLKNVSVPGSYPDQEKSLEEHLEVESELNSEFYAKELGKLEQYLAERDRIAQASPPPQPPPSDGGGGESEGGGAPEGGEGTVTTSGLTRGVSSLNLAAPRFQAPSAAPRSGSGSGGSSSVASNDVKLEISFTDEAFGIITAKQVEQNNLGTL